MSYEQQLREQQLQFANHLRNPALFPAPAGIEERRLEVYRKLFISNIGNLLANTFPVIRSILSDEQWQTLVRDFYTQHRCDTPLFPYIAGEFADYVLNERHAAGDYPFLAELAQYEWSEIALRHSDEALPICWPLVFRFPVHRIGASYLLQQDLPQQAPEAPTYLLMYRRSDEQIKFMESSAATFRLLQLLDDDALPTLQDVCAQLAVEMLHPDILALQTMVQDTLQQLRQAGVIK
jgi:hypothetical protein